MASKLEFNWSKFSKQEKLITYIAVAFLVMAIFDRLVLSAILAKIGSQEEQIRMQELSIKKNLKILSQKDLIQKQDQEFSVYLSNATSQEEELSSILKEIETLANKANVSLGEIKPVDLKEEKLMKKYSVSLSCEATMEQLADFIFRLETSNSLFNIVSYNIASKDKEKGTVKCNMSITKTVVAA
ncbi:MAG: hypothetical protein MUF05_03930 [Candidatus Omnitrophica bacterium]|jgi:Tfp pilus assembly protein PilO|nr:hypothetical protein [Candidatus Omnitrophota bacterium]